MKYCNHCKQEKELSEFYTNGWYKTKRKYKPICKVCEHKQTRHVSNEFIKNFYGGWECSECGFKGQPSQFDCHHRDPEKKELRISQSYKMAIGSKKRLLAELEKCDLLCANCHRLKHTKYQ